MVVKDELDRGVGGVSGIEEFEKLNEFAAAVAFLERGWTWPVSRSIPAIRVRVPWRLYS
jgi:hypothetical protein